MKRARERKLTLNSAGLGAGSMSTAGDAARTQDQETDASRTTTHDVTAWPFSPVGWSPLHPELAVSFLPRRATRLFALALTTPPCSMITTMTRLWTPLIITICVRD